MGLFVLLCVLRGRIVVLRALEASMLGMPCHVPVLPNGMSMDTWDDTKFMAHAIVVVAASSSCVCDILHRLLASLRTCS